jgi:hypothetical protein
MEFAGLPLHAIIVHAAVVLAPMTVLLAVVFAAVPSWRYLTRWPTALMTAVTLVTIWLTRASGHSYLESRPDLAPLVRDHQQLGDQLSLITTVFAVVVAVAIWGLGGRSGFASGRGGWPTRSVAIDRGLAVAVVVTSLVVLVWVIRTGDAGARAVWG